MFLPVLALYRIPQNELDSSEMVLFQENAERERRSTQKNYLDDFLRQRRTL
jgi:hypothetical protein